MFKAHAQIIAENVMQPISRTLFKFIENLIKNEVEKKVRKLIPSENDGPPRSTGRKASQAEAQWGGGGTADASSQLL